MLEFGFIARDDLAFVHLWSCTMVGMLWDPIKYEWILEGTKGGVQKGWKWMWEFNMSNILVVVTIICSIEKVTPPLVRNAMMDIITLQHVFFGRTSMSKKRYVVWQFGASPWTRGLVWWFQWFFCRQQLPLRPGLDHFLTNRLSSLPRQISDY